MTEEAQRHYPECGSTNDLARTWALDPAEPAPHGARVTADFQTRGRGRRGRTWEAAPGQNVLLSIVLRPQFPLDQAWQLAFLAGLAVADALTTTGLDPRLKWPNDVLLDGNKAGGILVETVPAPTPAWAAVVGIGLNVNQDDFPDAEALLHPPTSLRLETGQDWDVPDVARRLADALLRWVVEREEMGWDVCWEAYRTRLAVGAALRRGDQQAVLLDVDSDGSAHVRLADGTFTVWASVGEDRGETAPHSV